MDNEDRAEVEFFGIKLKVNNDHLATLLNSSVNDNVVVVGRRTIDLLARADEEDGAEAEAAATE